MPDRPIFDEQEQEFLRELLRRKVAFMVVGLSAAALQGAPVVTQDVDLWFRDLQDPGIAKALQKVRGTYIPPVLTNPPMFAGAGLNLFDIVVHMHGLGSFDEERGHVIRVPMGRFKLPVLRLDRIIASKKALGRDKDHRVLAVLSDVLTTTRETERPTAFSPTARDRRGEPDPNVLRFPKRNRAP